MERIKTTITINNGELYLNIPDYQWGTDNFIQMKEYALDIFENEFTLLAEEGEEYYYKAYILTGNVYYFITAASWAKKKAQKINCDPAKEKLEVLSNFCFAKTSSKVYVAGKRVTQCDATSLRFIENTTFAIDNATVYDYYYGYGLASMAANTAKLLFIPYCDYFADENNIYHKSGYTGKIEVVDTTHHIQLFHANAVVRKNKWNNTDAKNNEELQQRSDFLDTIQTPADLFRYFFPEVKAQWNTSALR